MRRAARLVMALGAALAAVLVLGAVVAAPASAHPLGNFTVNRYTGLLVGPDGVQLDHVVDLAEIPTAQLGRRVEDLDRVGTDTCTRNAGDLRLSLGGQRLVLRLEDHAATTSPGQGGLPVTRVTCRYSADADLDGGGDLVFQDRSDPGVVGWREVTAVGDRMTLQTSDVPAVSVSERLSNYPEDLLSSPLEVTTARLSVVPGGPLRSWLTSPARRGRWPRGES